MKKHGRDLAAAGDEGRHKVRREAKKLRYAAEFFTALFDRKRERRRYKHFVGVMEKLQEQLGALNDRAAAGDVFTTLGVDNGPSAVALLFPDDKGKSLDTAESAHDALVDAKRFWR